MTYGYENLKTGIDRRVAVEAKKLSDLRTCFEKIKNQLENDRKLYCIDLKKNLQLYAGQNQVETENFKRTILELVAKMDELDKVYGTTIRHIETVSMGALSTLPKKFETYKKAIKVSDKQTSEL